MTYKELFENLKNGAKWDIGVSISRTNPLPLDQYSIFESLDALNTYAASNAVAYPGQIVAVLTTGGTEETPTYTAEAYIIKAVGAGANIMKLASTTASGDVSADIANLQSAVATLQNDITETNNRLDQVKADKVDANALIEASGSEYRLVQYDDKGLVVAGKALEDSDVPGLGQVKTDIANLKEQVTGGVHWIGQANVDFGAENFPGIAEYTPAAGDIVARNGIEYIYNGTIWEEFGNEGAHLTLDQVNGAIDTKIQALNVAQINVGASKTISYIKEENGKIAAEPVDIQISTAQVTGLAEALADKQNADTDLTKIAAASKNTAAGFLNRTAEGEYVYKEALSEEEVKAVKVNNATHADAAAKVDHQLSIKVGNAEAQVYDGSTEVNVVVPQYELPAATTDALGGVKIGYATNGVNRAVELDENNKAFVTIPKETVYGVTENGGLEMVNHNFQIKAGGVTADMIAASAVKNNQIESVSANKLTQETGDYLILNCGDSTSL